MSTQFLLGPQSPVANLRQVVDNIQPDGAVVVITAGWRDSEGDIGDLCENLGRPVDDLMLYHRADEIFTREPQFRELHRERQNKLKELQRLYRMRLSPTLTAVRKLMRAQADPELLRLEQGAAIAQLQALDRHHLRRINTIHQDFDRRRAGMELAAAMPQRDAVHRQIDKAGLVLIAGGHVAVLLNRVRLFGLGPWLEKKSVIAWSAGAMAMSERIVLFHHRAPQGNSDAELLDAGLGIVRQRVFLPHARARLDWSNHQRMALFSRRFAPAKCCTLDTGSMIHLENNRVVAAAGSDVVTRSGRKKRLVGR